MVIWDYEKLEAMTRRIRAMDEVVSIDYRVLADNFEQIVVKLTGNGDLIPLLFDDLNMACKGKLYECIMKPDVDDEIREQLDGKERKRGMMKLKQFSRDISYDEWFEFINTEVLDFREKYPEYAGIIIED